MSFTDNEFREWHEYVYRQRNRYRSILENIITGVPIITGMASDYRKLKMEEIVKLAKEALEI